MKLLGLEIKRAVRSGSAFEGRLNQVIAQHNAILNQKNSHIKMLEKLNSKYFDMIGELTEQLETQNQGSLMEKALDKLGDVLLGGKSPINITPKHAEIPPLPPPKKQSNAHARANGNERILDQPASTLASRQEDSSSSLVFRPYSDEELVSFLRRVPQNYLPELAQSEQGEFLNIVRGYIGDIDQESALRGQQMIKERLNIAVQS